MTTTLTTTPPTESVGGRSHRALTRRAGLLAGAPAGLLAVGSVAMWGPEQLLDDSARSLQVSAGLGFLLITLLFVFGAAVRAHLAERLPATSPLPALAAAGPWGTATLLCWAYSLRSAFGLDGGSGPLGDSLALRQVTDSLPLASWIPMIAMLMAVAVAGLRQGAVPKALAVVIALLAAVDLVVLWAGIFPVGFPVGALGCLITGLALGMAPSTTRE